MTSNESLNDNQAGSEKPWIESRFCLETIFNVETRNDAHEANAAHYVATNRKTLLLSNEFAGGLMWKMAPK